MLQEVRDLQERAVRQLHEKSLGASKELTFRAPTGSGKTHMMADFMNRVLSERQDVVFLVSTLSKGGLAEQNYDQFKSLSDSQMFPHLEPYLISSEGAPEERLTIPTDKNVYILGGDLYKKTSRLHQGAMQNFLRTLTHNFFGEGLRKQVWLIRDECHVKTENIDELKKEYFSRVFHFSATPKMSRGQIPDVQISDEEAVNAKLIKRIELYEDPEIPVDAAIDKLIEIRQDYNNLLGVNPCLIIQISNEKKAFEEWHHIIKPALDRHQALKWMLIVDNKTKASKPNELVSDTNDDIKKKLPVGKWKDYAKAKDSTIDIIIFKMVISEGWDIPRACMLYQVRDTQSTQLDEQVIGRVRRNPRLLDFETLSEEAKELATTAWVWGVRPESMQKTQIVNLWRYGGLDLRDHIRVRTTRLDNLTEKKDFDIHSFIQPNARVTPVDIFTLYRQLARSENNMQALCYEYAEESPQRWWNFMHQIDKVKKAYDTYICDYDESMQVNEEISFPTSSSYTASDHNNDIDDWVWRRKDGNETFSFDSEAERKFATFLSKNARKYADTTEDKAVQTDEERFLWGKNFPSNSKIRYEYYANGIHTSYPDFILKDKSGHIHVFEVKSINTAKEQSVPGEDYIEKIKYLKDCYRAASKKLPDHTFYLPILDGAEWKFHTYEKGTEDIISQKQFVERLKAAQTD